MRNSEHECWNGDRDCSAAGAVDNDGVAVSSDLDRRGREVPDGTPMAPPVGFSAGPSLADFVQRMIREEVSRAARQAEMETFDEADDFDIEDDPLDEQTPYEKVFEASKPPDDWPMYYNPDTGLYGQLPPTENAPEGFVKLRREASPPAGWALPEAPKPRRRGNKSSVSDPVVEQSPLGQQLAEEYTGSDGGSTE